MGDLEIFDDFEKFLDDDLEKGLEQKDKFEVKDLSSANWCAGKITFATKKIDEAKKFRDAIIEKAKRWYENYTKEYEQTIERMSYYLEPYVKSEIMEKKGKSVKLMGVTAGYRTGQMSIDMLMKPRRLNRQRHKECP